MRIMELKYIVLTIIKILVSVPAILFTTNLHAEAAALMGGYLDNNNETVGFVGIPFESEENYRRIAAPENYSTGYNSSESTTEDGKSEEIPNPSALVVPGYNLPENIFNKGIPFYMEKDPLTGQVDFTNKTSEIDDDFYEYTDEGNDHTDDIYNKANINRKDGSIGSHRPSDINQLTPNFHDFLNLPIKYNSNKYVYPLISSSYANTKVQGNVNKYHNHKTYVTKFPTFNPSNGPFLSSSKQYYQDYEEITSTTTPKVIASSSTTPSKGTIKYQSFNEDFSEDYDYDSYEKNTKQNFNFGDKDVYYTTQKINNIYLTTSSTPVTTTKKVMSLLEQLFGVYDETVTTEKPKSSTLFSNLPSNKLKNSQEENKLDKTTTTSSTTASSLTHTNVATGSNMEMENIYEEYDDDYYNNQNISEFYTTHKPPSISTSTMKPFSTTKIMPSTSFSSATIFNSHSYKEPTHSAETVSTKQRSELTTETYFTSRETSLPLGDNHVSSPKVTLMPTTDRTESGTNNYRPIIIATQNLRNQLNNEKVVPKPFSVNSQLIPSTSRIHISPDQDTVSFVVGHHQSMDGSSYTEPNSQNGFNSNYFQPQDDIIYNNSPDTVIFQQPQLKKHQEISGSAVTIQTQTNSEASLSIGVPVEHIKKVPGQVMDAELDLDNVKSDHPTNGVKIVFPDEKDVSLTSLVPPPSTPNPPLISSNREILKLASKPMFHQLPSDLTPPKEELGKFPLRLDSPRPPWDPRPGHFFSGNLEYSRPPRPLPDIAYKRIDTLPNILPQFRPNMKSRGSHNSKPHDYKHTIQHGVHRTPPHFYDNRLHREPLLERPSNRPLEFYEKLQPPPLPPKNLHNFRKIASPPLLDQRSPIAQDRKGEDYHKKPSMEKNTILEPPKIVTSLKKIEGEVETLQMLQAKQLDKKELYAEPVNTIVQDTNKTDKPVYVVYPVNSPPIKLDVIDTNKRESVVIGTRAELPLPPSEIRDDYTQEKSSSILGIKDRNDSPILKPHSRLPPFSIKTDFPYPLERPDISILHPVPDAPNNGIGSEDNLHSDNRESFLSNNQWNTIDENIESRIVTRNKLDSHIFTEKPIAVAYTPTEPSTPNIYDKFAMSHFGLSNSDSDASNPFHSLSTNEAPKKTHMTDSKLHALSNHRMDEDVSDDVKIRTEQDFQAPFQASVKVDSPSQGWSVIRKNDSKNNDELETTTASAVTTSEFNIENFKPQLEGGFKPIYTFRSEDGETKVEERQE